MALFLLLFVILPLCIGSDISPKQLAGPPSEFEANKIPTPQNGALIERSAFIPLLLTRNTQTGKITWMSDLPVDSTKKFGFATFSPEKFLVTLFDPDGYVVDLKSHQQEISYPNGYYNLPGVMYSFEEGEFRTGVYKVELVSERVLEDGEEIPKGAIILFNDHNLKMHTALSSYNLRDGEVIGLVSRITDEYEVPKGRTPRAVRDVVFTAVINVVDPDGTEQEVQMHDDGLHGDELANDGVYAGYLKTTEVGLYRTSAVLKGRTAEGVEFLRSTQHIIPIVANEIALNGYAFAQKKDETRLLIHIGVSFDSSFDSLNRIFRAYSEVWGQDKDENEIPVCWISSMVNVRKVQNMQVVTLELDLNWLRKAEARGPLTLKNVYIQNAQYHVPLSEMEAIPVKLDYEVHTLLQTVRGNRNLSITTEMKVGVLPVHLRRTNRTRQEPSPTLLLTHGYCPGPENPWAKYIKDWTNPAFFLEIGSNMVNEEFARKLAQFADENHMDSFSIIAHSQGGLASLHLINYYFTGIDASKGGRKLQTVGSPWLGNTGAGSVANLVKIFGYGCGPNFDLTTDGATLWLTGITSENRNQVFFYTTTYQTKTIWGDYCNAAANFILRWPNDGTSELDHAILPGGNDMGNTEGWCHSLDMEYPPQYYDRERNVIMNQMAAR